jgi:hypothetical protein
MQAWRITSMDCEKARKSFLFATPAVTDLNLFSLIKVSCLGESAHKIVNLFIDVQEGNLRQVAGDKS